MHKTMTIASSFYKKAWLVYIGRTITMVQPLYLRLPDNGNGWGQEYSMTTEKMDGSGV